ncbi:MAG TPA: NrfD/PsrC family molybdoenzyme membrane anchor subunit [Alphaproteobacteria bacterium]|nr:NrfD/PsrC family molybdoenzyme membrane anchor subunit [Alphaproteobacteria bacterium]
MRESYYGRPAVKPSLYGWTVALYIFAGGLAGGVQLIATAIDFTSAAPGGYAVVLAGRALALAGAIAGGLLLIADLHVKRRFYNMLRIFRPTSPMSIGTYVLMAFGFFSLVTLAASPLDLPAYAAVSGGVAALFGLAMTTYTAPLLATTSTPLWAASPRLLACRFAASAMATAAAALLLVAWAAGAAAIAHALAWLGAVSLAVELAASILSVVRLRSLGLATPLTTMPWGPIHALGVQLLGTALPLALLLYGLTQAGGALLIAVAAAVLTLAGGVLMRGTVLMAGNASAGRPDDYFRYAAPDDRRRGA